LTAATSEPDRGEYTGREHEGDTHGTGSTIGDLMTLPPGPLDPGAAPGEAAPSGAYYDPPRSY